MINIVRCFTFGNKPLFSVKNNKINENSIKLMKDEQKTLIKFFHFPLGYEIKNIGNKLIDKIKIPEYSFENKKWIGEIKEVSLEPGKYLVLPTKYLMLLLFEKRDEDVYIDNGKMIPYIPKLNCNSDSDAYLTNFIFEPLMEWKSLVDPSKNSFYYRPMSYFRDEHWNYLGELDYNNMNYTIIEKDMLSLFGNYNNKQLSIPLAFISYVLGNRNGK